MSEHTGASCPCTLEEFKGEAKQFFDEIKTAETVASCDALFSGLAFCYLGIYGADYQGIDEAATVLKLATRARILREVAIVAATR